MIINPIIASTCIENINLKILTICIQFGMYTLLDIKIIILINKPLILFYNFIATPYSHVRKSCIAPMHSSLNSV